jgi:hypothetical protein
VSEKPPPKLRPDADHLDVAAAEVEAIATRRLGRVDDGNRRHIGRDRSGETADQFTGPEPLEEMVIAALRKIGYGYSRDDATDLLGTLDRSLPFV